jgi:glucose-6-phosphate isomerase
VISNQFIQKGAQTMEMIPFDYKNSCLISQKELESLEATLGPEIIHVYNTRASGYTTPYGSINLPFDEDLLETVEATVKDKKALNPKTLVVIGIGGSNLGTIAVLEAIRGKFYNEHHEVSVYFVDTVDSDHIHDIAELVEHELETGNNILLNIISKSGITTETIANFEIFLEILKNHRPYNYHQFIVATTDKNSALWKFAQEEKCARLAIPETVGGRYSVLSAVGLFPLCFLDIEVEKLQAGAQQGFADSTEINLAQNYAALSAAVIATHYNRGLIIHDTFLFSVALESLGGWYRQLSAESLGKAYDRNNQPINTGVVPTISIGSTDLHSVAQLYLAGLRNRFTTFVAVGKNNTELRLPDYQEFEPLVPHIQTQSLSTIMNAILEGTKRVYQEDKRPFVSVNIPEKSAYYIGYFMQMKMIEIMYLGFLLNVNPFNQPQVENYKKETKSILKRKSDKI